MFIHKCFNTQPPEGGWIVVAVGTVLAVTVSTHSRPKAAGARQPAQSGSDRSFNTQPPEGGWELVEETGLKRKMFQHTAARRRLGTASAFSAALTVSTHSRPKAAGMNRAMSSCCSVGFQHTAARRRLESLIVLNRSKVIVSTHSRPKAAGSKMP